MRNRIFISVLALLWGLFASRAAFAIPAQQPLFLVTGVSPMVMFAMSANHTLFKKAFADYSDLNKDGIIDNTYTDSFDYYGYFDSNRCYSYSNGLFSPEDEAAGPNNHHCAGVSGDWSGNFLNWASMTRIDVIRKALFGGKRAVDTDAQTVLERALLPSDVHSFVKVFTPASGDSIANYLPSGYASAGTVSLCSSTPASTGRTENINTGINPPKLRIASGDWGRWAADEVLQCLWHEERIAAGLAGGGSSPGSSPGQSSNLFAPSSSDAPSVRVDVCVANKVEENCRIYNSGTEAKPIGLLQEYGEDKTLRFGLTTGSYDKRDKGGVLRKAVGYIARNTDPADDEINLADGTFNTSVNGIIASINALRITDWDYAAKVYQDCRPFGKTIAAYLADANATDKCSNWGNPLSELYLESVRYLIGEGSPTGTFNTTSDPLGLQSATWNDPMTSDEWCSPMNIVVLSSGDNNFDTDHLGTVPSVLGSINSATDAIGAAEGFGGDVFIGEVGSSPIANPDSNVCSAKAFTSLSQMRGLCPATPVGQGGYAIAGLAYTAKTTDLRTDRQNNPGTGEGQTINTYGIAMAKNLPDFAFPVGTGRIVVVPHAYAGPTGSTPPVVSTLWKSSSLADVTVEETVYSGQELIYARFLAVWEDSAAGNDYDMDVISRISVCVGAECANHDDDGDGSNDTPAGTGVARTTTRIVHANAGVSMKVGFVVSGTTADGEYVTLRKQNGSAGNFSVLDNINPSREPTPVVVEFTPGTSLASNLPSPLELAAKYGSFNDIDDSGVPDDPAEWDSDNNGLADTFFYADDPSQIGPKLAAFLSTIATTSSSASVVANSVSLQTSTRIYQARFDSDDWTGTVLSFPVDITTGTLQPPDWSAGNVIALQDWDGGREFLTWNPETGSGVPLRWNDNGTPSDLTDDTTDLTEAQRIALNINPDSNTDDGLGEERLTYLRGDDSGELAGGGGNFFRDRPLTPLGDVVHSTPTVVAAPNFGYSDSLESVAYSTFKASWADADCFVPYSDPPVLRSLGDLDREPILYFGANDGALHGISACTGEERIAYVPNAVFPKLNKLTSTNYAHEYYVDGPATVVDAFWSSAWHTTLVGTLRGGGKGVFALDVTDPSTFNEGNAGQVVLWEIDDTTDFSGDGNPDYPDLGYTFSQPAIVKAEGHGWVAVFGNGYYSTSGKAVLYIVRINDGVLLRAIDLSASGPGSAAHGANNGLSTVSPIDRDGDGEVDLIYGGDLNGNVWRFENNGSGFIRANATLLYSAKSDPTGVQASVAQPITSRMAVGYHPTSAVGRIVYFGTGKYFEQGDQDPNAAVEFNTMYGIWDRDNGATVPSVT
ncbi:MAG: PilC/PilY family type IV pilus protein, partial [Sedimenticolaceae bacterium]